MTPDSNTGIVLAGGYSRRFGDEDKALAHLHGEPLLEHVVTRLEAAVDRVVVSCREAQVPAFRRVLEDTASHVGFVTDPIPGAGPLAGVNETLTHVDTTYVAVVACDIPTIEPAFIGYLFEEATDRDGAVPELPSGIPQPTVAVYRTEAMQKVSTTLLESDVYGLQEALESLDIQYVPPSTIEERIGFRTLRNVNTPEELAALEKDLA